MPLHCSFLAVIFVFLNNLLNPCVSLYFPDLIIYDQETGQRSVDIYLY